MQFLGKEKGQNHDLTVAEYKVAKEEEKIEKLSTDKIGLEADILVLNHKKSEIKPENRTGTIEQLAQNVEAVEQQVQLMGVKMSRNRL